jgi:hypothetical protein
VVGGGHADPDERPPLTGRRIGGRTGLVVGAVQAVLQLLRSLILFQTRAQTSVGTFHTLAAVLHLTYIYFLLKLANRAAHVRNNIDNLQCDVTHRISTSTCKRVVVRSAIP